MIIEFSKFASLKENVTVNTNFLFEDMFDEKSQSENISKNAEVISKNVIDSSLSLKDNIKNFLYNKLNTVIYGTSDKQKNTGSPVDYIVTNSEKLIDYAVEIQTTGTYSTFWRSTMGYFGTFAIAVATAWYLWKKRSAYKKALRYIIKPEVEAEFIQKTKTSGVLKLKKDVENYKRGQELFRETNGKFYVLLPSGSKEYLKFGYDKTLTRPMKDILLDEWKNLPLKTPSTSTIKKVGIFLSRVSQPQALATAGATISLPFIWENLNVLWDWFMSNVKSDEPGYKTFVELGTVINNREQYIEKFYQSLIETPAFDKDLDLPYNVITSISNFDKLGIDNPDKIGYAVCRLIAQATFEYQKGTAVSTIYSAVSNELKA